MRALQLSGLSRNSPRPGLFGRPSNSATKNGPCTFSVQEPLLLIPSGETSAQENQEARAAGESRRRPFFSTEPLLLSPSGPRPVAGHEVRRSRSPRVAALLEGTTFTHAFPARPAPRKTKRSGLPKSRRTVFSTEPLLLIPSGAQTRAGHEVRRSRSPRAAALCSRGNHFYSCLPSETGVQEARRSGAPGGALHSFFVGTTFPHSFQPRLASPGSE